MGEVGDMGEGEDEPLLLPLSPTGMPVAGLPPQQHQHQQQQASHLCEHALCAGAVLGRDAADSLGTGITATSLPATPTQREAPLGGGGGEGADGPSKEQALLSSSLSSLSTRKPWGIISQSACAAADAAGTEEEGSISPPPHLFGLFLDHSATASAQQVSRSGMFMGSAASALSADAAAASAAAGPSVPLSLHLIPPPGESDSLVDSPAAGLRVSAAASSGAAASGAAASGAAASGGASAVDSGARESGAESGRGIGSCTSSTGESGNNSVGAAPGLIPAAAAAAPAAAPAAATSAAAAAATAVAAAEITVPRSVSRSALRRPSSAQSPLASNMRHRRAASEARDFLHELGARRPAFMNSAVNSGLRAAHHGRSASVAVLSGAVGNRRMGIEDAAKGGKVADGASDSDSIAAGSGSAGWEKLPGSTGSRDDGGGGTIQVATGRRTRLGRHRSSASLEMPRRPLTAEAWQHVGEVDDEVVGQEQVYLMQVELEQAQLPWVETVPGQEQQQQPWQQKQQYQQRKSQQQQQPEQEWEEQQQQEQAASAGWTQSVGESDLEERGLQGQADVWVAEEEDEEGEEGEEEGGEEGQEDRLVFMDYSSELAASDARGCSGKPSDALAARSTPRDSNPRNPHSRTAARPSSASSSSASSSSSRGHDSWNSATLPHSAVPAASAYSASTHPLSALPYQKKPVRPSVSRPSAARSSASPHDSWNSAAASFSAVHPRNPTSAFVSRPSAASADHDSWNTAAQPASAIHPRNSPSSLASRPSAAAHDSWNDAALPPAFAMSQPFSRTALRSPPSLPHRTNHLPLRSPRFPLPSPRRPSPSREAQNLALSGRRPDMHLRIHLGESDPDSCADPLPLVTPGPPSASSGPSSAASCPAGNSSGRWGQYQSPRLPPLLSPHVAASSPRFDRLYDLPHAKKSPLPRDLVPDPWDSPDRPPTHLDRGPALPAVSAHGPPPGLPANVPWEDSDRHTAAYLLDRRSENPAFPFPEQLLQPPLERHFDRPQTAPDRSLPRRGSRNRLGERLGESGRFGPGRLRDLEEQEEWREECGEEGWEDGMGGGGSSSSGTPGSAYSSAGMAHGSRKGERQGGYGNRQGMRYTGRWAGTGSFQERGGVGMGGVGMGGVGLGGVGMGGMGLVGRPEGGRGRYGGNEGGRGSGGMGGGKGSSSSSSSRGGEEHVVLVVVLTVGAMGIQMVRSGPMRMRQERE
ncbi:hypothetical protein CLOP_g18295 [Closterium sp. NIES-67]|nr:hypothetical protein CLOP_g18295 [Closterium sp. NIES-67]